MAAAGERLRAGSDSLEELFTGASRFVERLPRLRILLDRAGVICSEELAAEVAETAEFALQGIDSGTAGELLAGHEGSSITGVLHAPKWGARLLVCADRAAVGAIVDMMLGGEGPGADDTPERAFTKLDVRVAATFFARLAKVLAATFAGVAETPFVPEDSDTEIAYDTIGKQNGSIVLARYRLTAAGRTGTVNLAIPRSALNPLRDVLAHVPVEDAAPADPGWTRKIEGELTRTSVVLSAVLDERMGLLGEIADLRVGQVLPLSATANSRVRLECNGERLIWCQLGKSNEVYSLRVDAFVDQQQEFMDEILSA